MSTKFLAPDDGTDAGAGTAVVDAPATPAAEPAAQQPAQSLIPAAEPSPAQTPGPLGDDWIGPDGTFRQGWYQRFDPEIQTHIAKYKSVEELAKGTGNQAKFIGQKGIFMPNEKSSPEDVAEFRKAIGVPETPEAYQLKPETLPPGMQWSDDLAKPFLKIAHEENISQRGLKRLTEAFTQMESLKGQHVLATAQYEYERKITEGTAKLQEIWRGDYEKNRTKAQQAAILAGVDPLDPGFLSPNVVAGFVRLANMISEDKLVGITGGIAPAGNTLALAEDIVGNPQNPKYDLYHSVDANAPGVADVRHQVRQWFKEGTKKPVM